MSKLTIYVARHGKTMMNTLNRVQGWCDSPLTNEGIEVARHLGLGLQNMNFKAAYCSDLRRTRQTARIVLESCGQPGLPIVEHEGFREFGFGGFESHSNDLVWEKAPLYMGYINSDEMDKDLYSGKINYGDIMNTVGDIDPLGIAENYEIARTRTQNALRDIIAANQDKGDANILVIAHAMCMAAMLMSLGGEELLNGDLKNACVCKVVAENGNITVESMGDMSYVEHGAKLAQQ